MKKRNLLLLCFCFFLVGCKDQLVDNNIYNSSIENEETSGQISFPNEESDIEQSDQSIESKSPSISEEDVESSVNNNQNKFYNFDKKISIYINPSVQYTNAYYGSLGNEGQHMNDISKELVYLLDTYTNLIVYSNNALPGMSLSKSVAESNKFNVDYHLALHSNAGGGKGSEIFHTKSSYNFSKSILNSLNEILPYNTRGLKDGSKALYELKNTTASASLLEILFHDDYNQAKYIIDNKKEIAKAIYEGIVLYFLEKWYNYFGD